MEKIDNLYHKKSEIINEYIRLNSIISSQLARVVGIAQCSYIYCQKSGDIIVKYSPETEKLIHKYKKLSEELFSRYSKELEDAYDNIIKN